MGTRKKLLLGALGFVAATTTLALWQAAPKIERVARRLPMLDSCDEELYWLSNHEVIVGSTRHTMNSKDSRTIPEMRNAKLADRMNGEPRTEHEELQDTDFSLILILSPP